MLFTLMLAACTAPNGVATPHAPTPAPGEPASVHADADASTTPDEGLPPPPSSAPHKTKPGAAGKVDYTCTTDADCTVKDVGNCCGYYPACVNVDSPTFPEQVKAACAESGMAGICGFPAISGCQCVQGRCKSEKTGAIRLDEGAVD